MSPTRTPLWNIINFDITNSDNQENGNKDIKSQGLFVDIKGLTFTGGAAIVAVISRVLIALIPPLGSTSQTQIWTGAVISIIYGYVMYCISEKDPENKISNIAMACINTIFLIATFIGISTAIEPTSIAQPIITVQQTPVP